MPANIIRYMAICRRLKAVIPRNLNQTSLSFSSQSSSPFSDLLLQRTPQDETLISEVASILREHRSRSRWNFIKSLYPDGFTPAQVSQITLRIKNNPRLALRFFLWSERKSLCDHDLLSYATIIHILARSRLKSTAQTLIRKAIQASEMGDPILSTNPPKIFEALAKTYRTCDSAPFVFDLLIRACLQANKIERTVEIVRQLRSRGICPMLPTCNSLIKTVSQVRGSVAGFEIYKEIFEGSSVKISPNTQTFNTLLISFYRELKMDKLDAVWMEMAKLGCSPNIFSYSVLIAAFCDEGRIEEAVNLWEEIQRKQMNPDIMAYNTLIKGFSENGEVGRAEELLREMILKEIEPTCDTYENLIKGHCKIGVVDSAVLIYKDMRRRDFRPDASTIDELIRELCARKRVCEARRVFRDVMKEEGFFPGRKSYGYLIMGLCEIGKMEEALKLQAEMVGKGFEPDFEIYITFIEGYRKEGDVENLVKLQKEMVQMGFTLPADS